MRQGRSTVVGARDVERAALPRVPGAVPLVLVRVLLGLVGVAVVASTVTGTAWVVLALLLVVAGAAWPSSYGVWVGIALILLHAAVSPAPSWWGLAALVAGVHLLHVLGSLALALPVQGTIEARVLLRPLRRFVAVQVGAQVLVVVVTWASGRRGHVPLLALVAAVALAALAWWLTGRRARS